MIYKRGMASEQSEDVHHLYRCRSPPGFPQRSRIAETGSQAETGPELSTEGRISGHEAMLVNGPIRAPRGEGGDDDDDDDHMYDYAIPDEAFD